jgi:hypothetical protein
MDATDAATIIFNKLMAAMNKKFDAMNEKFEQTLAPITGFLDHITKLEKKITDLEEKVAMLEKTPNKDEKQRHLVIIGLPEQPGERTTDLHNLIMDLMKAMKIKDFDYDDVFRMGQKRPGKTRPILLKLIRTRDKWTIFNAKKLLQNGPSKFSKVFINEDLSPEERKMSADLRRELKTAKSTDNSLTGTIRGPTLFIRKDGGIVKKMRWTGPDQIREFQ